MPSKLVVRRAIWFSLMVTASFAAVGTRYWYLQVTQASHYQSLARQDYLRKLPVPAPRGNIVTSDGVTVAGSTPSWSLYYLNRGTPLPQAEVARLARYLGQPAKTITATIASGLKNLPSYQPIPVADGLTAQQMTAIEENIGSLPAMRIQPVAIRNYPFNSMMGNIIGYLSDITGQQYAAWHNLGYTMTSLVGAAGLEQQYQQYLHGRAGGQYAEVNRQGQLVRLFGQSVPTPGDTLHLTINWRLQQTAQKALAYDMYVMQHANHALQAYSPNATSGGVIAIDPQNGDVLALASLPSYNPNKLLPGTATRLSYYQSLNQNPLKPFFLRPIMGRYSPGSIFKPIMAVAALASGVVTPTTQVFDPGYFPKIPSFHNWYPPGFGWVNIEKAIALSDDTFFYTMGYDMGIQVMDKWMSNFLLNRPTGIDLPGEVTSIMPTPQYLQQAIGVPWTAGWNLNTAIGQGVDQFSLIALARADSAIANGGTLYQPHLVSSITSPTGKLIKSFPPVVQGKINLPYSVWHTVHVGMEMSAQDANVVPGFSGTGYGALAGLPVPVASKTGTAQVIGRANNSLFLTYGPMPHPTLLIIVYVHSGNWGADSGFVARAIYDQYFKVKDPTAQPLLDRTFGGPFAWPFGYPANPAQIQVP
ncbi:MAG: penicillin-binding protein 2 [Thermaerobacter sp.]|nr:penicillin-binding protein 2 [Thermaerobacter sp.]